MIFAVGSMLRSKTFLMPVAAGVINVVLLPFCLDKSFEQ